MAGTAPNRGFKVFAHPIENATRYRQPDAPRLVEVAARHMRRMVTFALRDNGIGIEPQYHDQIFVIFKRFQTREAYPGTGIGLAIMKRIVDRHGGTIRVESTPGDGPNPFTLPAA